jgi:DNA-directed RNA polymerase specialized sigma subunit
MIDSQEHFRKFAVSLEKAIKRHEEQVTSSAERFEYQFRQLTRLTSLEDAFRRALIADPQGPLCYSAFVRFICDERKNILAARPFFRERQPTFTQEISKALKARADRSLYKFRINYQFVRFVLDRFSWSESSEVAGIAREIAEIRIRLVEANLPLAISQARIFWSRTPQSQLSYMDLVQIASEGLISAIDKFVLPEPYSPVFRCVAIGRMLGNFIESYSETLLHFFPGDRRKIYRANKLLRKHNGEHSVDYDKLADEINRDSEPAHHTTPTEIASLVAAASTVSTDASAPTNVEVDKDTSVINRFAAPEVTQPDVQVETRDAYLKLEEAVQRLPVFERKLLQLMGVSF